MQAGAVLSARTAIFVALSAALSIPTIVDIEFRFELTRSMWLILIGVNLALWCSWPRYKSPLLQKVCATITLLVVANQLLSPLVRLASDDAVTIAAPNSLDRFRHVGELLPGFSDVHVATTDGRGYRTNGPIDYDRKPAGVLRVVAIGASTTEQAVLDDRKTWTYLLAEQLALSLHRKVEMINAGVAGARAMHNFRTFLASEAYAPDVAIFMLGINDWNHAIRAANRSMPLRLLEGLSPFSFIESVLFGALQRTRAGLIAVFDPPDARRGGLREEAGAYFAKWSNALARRPVRDFRMEAVDGQYARSVANIIGECKRRAIVCVFTDQPTAYDANIEPGLRKLLWMTPPNESYTLSLETLRDVAATYNGWLENTVAASGLVFCPLARSFPPTTELFFDDCHFNEAGTRRVAALMADCLRKTLSSR